MPAQTKRPTSQPRPQQRNRGKRSAHHRGGATESMEDYLECIANIADEQGFVRATDVAERLDLRRASVSIMIKRLADFGYLNHIRYRGFALTEEGAAVAAKIRERHETLTEFFELLGLSAGSANTDVEGIEHHVSPDTLHLLRDFVEFWKSRPATAKAYAEFRSRKQKEAVR